MIKHIQGVSKRITRFAEHKNEALDLPVKRIYGLELWVVTERTRMWIQVEEMSFLQRVAGLHLL